jgi:serine/threonine protein kinase
MWAIGIVFAVLISVLSPFYCAKKDRALKWNDLLDKIFKTLGYPNKDYAPSIFNSLQYKAFMQKMSSIEQRINEDKGNVLREKFNFIKPEGALDMLESLLALDPLKRITAIEAY